MPTRPLAALVVAATVALSVLAAAPADARAVDDGPGIESPGGSRLALGPLRARVQELRDLAASAAVPEPAEPEPEPESGPEPEPEPVPCDQITGTHIPRLVWDIFTCRLTEAGGDPASVSYIAAEAVTVARCESVFDPAAVVFGGRYLEQRHPWTGMYYSAAGVFQFIRTTADDWIVGGYANVFDPTANIDAAARLFLHNMANGYPGWSDWACAAANDGFKVGSVLPGWPGGPAELPDWAWQG